MLNGCVWKSPRAMKRLYQIYQIYECGTSQSAGSSKYSQNPKELAVIRMWVKLLPYYL